MHVHPCVYDSPHAGGGWLRRADGELAFRRSCAGTHYIARTIGQPDAQPHRSHAHAPNRHRRHLETTTAGFDARTCTSFGRSTGGCRIDRKRTPPALNAPRTGRERTAAEDPRQAWGNLRQVRTDQAPFVAGPVTDVHRRMPNAPAVAPHSLVCRVASATKVWIDGPAGLLDTGFPGVVVALPAEPYSAHLQLLLLPQRGSPMWRFT